MATTDDNKLRSLAAVLGIGSLALFGVTACEDGGADEPEDDAVENGEDPAEDPADDPADEEDPLEEDPADEEEDEGL